MADIVYKRISAEDLLDTIQYREGSFINGRNQRMFYLSAFPNQTKVRAIVFFVHGIGDHSGRYYQLYRHLCEWGFGVVACDLVAHGRSDHEEEQLRAHTRAFQFLIDDVNGLLSMLKKDKWPSLLADSNQACPLIYMGMSFGTLLGIHVLLSGVHKFSAIVLIATAVSIEWSLVLRFQAALSGILTRIIPRLRVVPAIDITYLSRNVGFLEDISRDPLMTVARITARMGEQSLRAMRAIESDPRLADSESYFGQVSLLSMMGSEDHVTSVPSAKEFFDRVGCQDKEFKTFDGLYHCIFEEPEKEDVYQFLKDWLQTRFS